MSLLELYLHICMLDEIYFFYLDLSLYLSSFSVYFTHKAFPLQSGQCGIQVSLTCHGNYCKTWVSYSQGTLDQLGELMVFQIFLKVSGLQLLQDNLNILQYFEVVCKFLFSPSYIYIHDFTAYCDIL